MDFDLPSKKKDPKKSAAYKRALLRKKEAAAAKTKTAEISADVEKFQVAKKLRAVTLSLIADHKRSSSYDGASYESELSSYAVTGYGDKITLPQSALELVSSIIGTAVLTFELSLPTKYDNETVDEAKTTASSTKTPSSQSQSQPQLNVSAIPPPAELESIKTNNYDLHNMDDTKVLDKCNKYIKAELYPKVTHAGVIEFTAPPDTIGLPYLTAKTLGLIKSGEIPSDGDTTGIATTDFTASGRVRVRLKRLEKAELVVLKPDEETVKRGFYNSDVKETLTVGIQKNRTTISEGDYILAWERGKEFILECKRGGGCVVDCDLEVEFGDGKVAEEEEEEEEEESDKMESSPTKTTTSAATKTATATLPPLPPPTYDPAQETSISIRAGGVQTQSFKDVQLQKDVIEWVEEIVGDEGGKVVTRYPRIELLHGYVGDLGGGRVMLFYEPATEN